MGAVEDCPWYCGLPMANCECESKVNLKAIKWIDDAEKEGYKTCSGRFGDNMPCDDTTMCMNIHVRELGVEPDRKEEKCVPVERTAELIGKAIYENLEKVKNNEPTTVNFKAEIDQLMENSTICDPTNPVTCKENETCLVHPYTAIHYPDTAICMQLTESERKNVAKLQSGMDVYKSSRQAM